MGPGTVGGTGGRDEDCEGGGGPPSLPLGAAAAAAAATTTAAAAAAAAGWSLPLAVEVAVAVCNRAFTVACEQAKSVVNSDC